MNIEDMESKLRVRLGEALLQASLITPEQLERALQEQKHVHGRLGEILVRMGFVPEEKLARFLATYLHVPYVELTSIGDLDPGVVHVIPEAIARRMNLIAIAREGKTLTIAMSDPFDVTAIDTVRMRTGYSVKPSLARPSAIQLAVERYYAADQSVESSIQELVELEVESGPQDASDSQQLKVEADGAPVVRYVNTLLATAVREGASDIHIEPQENTISVRLRIDGMLRLIAPPPKKMQSAIITRVKILGRLDIAERRLPQDGRFKMNALGHEVDVRLSSLPTIYGEKLVMRVLDQTTGLRDMSHLGISEALLDQLQRSLKMPYGMILVTGPTGSGKTTTLYAALHFVKSDERNIVTVEDPVEYRLAGISQVQAKPMIGLTFAHTLRSILRQDPDVIMVGEIRDQETVEIAIKAALTGHLVLSTLHTNDAPSAISRLGYMGIEPYLIASSTNLVIAQRLVRRICSECRERVSPPADVLRRVCRIYPELTAAEFRHGRGCDACSGTGYRGRVGLYEFLVVNDEMKRLIVSGAKENVLRDTAHKNGFPSLAASGVERVREGTTTLEELMSITFDDEPPEDVRPKPTASRGFVKPGKLPQTSLVIEPEASAGM